MYGADINALEALATSMDDAAARLDMIARTLGRQLGGSPWRGGDADGFRGAWEGRLLGSINRAGAALHDAARQLRTNADQQRQASNSTGLAGLGGSRGRSLGTGLVSSGGLSPWDRLQIAGAFAGVGAGLLDIPSQARTAALMSRVLTRTGGLNSLERAAFLRGLDRQLLGGPQLLSRLGVVTSAVTLPFEVFDVVQSINTNGLRSWATAGQTFEVVGPAATLLAAAGVTAMAPVALVASTAALSFQAGSLAGRAVDHLVGQNLVDDAARRMTGGSNALTGAQAAQLTRRYEGGSGFVNYLGDSARTAGNGITSVAKKVWGVFG